MAASNYDSGTGRKIYYNIAYGKLSTRIKEVPEDFEEIEASTLKSAVSKVEEIDLRRKYVLKDKGDYKYQVFYDVVEGTITNVEKESFDKGVSLRIRMLDTDGDEVWIQCKFYSKYTENILNRLLGVSTFTSVLKFTPYSIPSDMTTDDGTTIKFYNQGAGIRENEIKVENFYKGATFANMPPTERMLNAEGQEVTSRVKRINFLYDELQKKMSATPSLKQEAAPKPQTVQSFDTPDEYDDDLPF